MRWKIIAVGKPKLSWASEGIKDYLARLKHFVPLELVFLKSSNKDQEAIGLLEASEGCHRIVLDERGKTWTSRKAAAYIQELELRSIKQTALIIGGGDGLAAKAREKADHLWALSPATLQHELALLVACEQIYRSYSILRKHPYHRD
ncbi:MAG: 23S rRNA (pseudouridine(1915)-N(3))-methyltransferase RlmH [Chthoniobacterales bacterium]